MFIIGTSQTYTPQLERKHTHTQTN